MGESGALQLSNLNKKFTVEGEKISIIENVNLTVSPGEFISIIGPSGCGKTTLLRMIIGLESDYEGDIILAGKKLNGPSLNRGVVFQDHRLLPWLTIEKNVGLGLEGKKYARNRKQIIQDHLELVGLRGFEKAYPYQLSGGMAQRASIARALVNRPEILLLDEPLGALDALTRMYMQQELEKIWQQEGGITMIMVTHDVEEAIYLSDKVVIMSNRPGKLKKTIPVPLARPRDRASYDFIKIKEEVLREFHLQAEHQFSYAI
ncbi:MAG: NitT/TauT family transport system ATP-binding [Geobacteraceae bacterium]|nr:MAG: NitT/TauT family transport system ATP-binding [Geobacteraceae bacterium]